MSEAKTKNLPLYLDYRSRLHNPDTAAPFEMLTCADCPDAVVCEFAFDNYNTDGDCLGNK